VDFVDWYYWQEFHVINKLSQISEMTSSFATTKNLLFSRLEMEDEKGSDNVVTHALGIPLASL
jgi:hypothetical protein